MKILLINSPIRMSDKPRHYPQGLCLISAWLKKHGYEDVHIFDNNAYRVNTKEMIGKLLGQKWDIIGMSGLVTTYRWQKRVLPQLRKAFPDALMVCGGGVTHLPKEYMEWMPDLDVGIMGEAEIPFLEFVKKVDNQEDWKGTKGVVYRENGEVKINPPADLVQDIDTLPFPDWDAVPMHIYLENSSTEFTEWTAAATRRVDIVAERGCPYICDFCTSGLLDKRTVRFNSAKYMVEVLKALRFKYAIDYSMLLDEDFSLQPKRLFEFCDLMEKEGLAEVMKWDCLGRVNLVTQEILDRIAEVGCTDVGYGFESASKKVLDAIKKRTTVEQMQRALDMTIKAGMRPIPTWMFGHPVETPEDMLETARFWVKNKIKTNAFFVTPYPGTKLFNDFRPQMEKMPGGLEKWIMDLDDATKFSINMTKMPTPVLMGLKRLAEEWRIDLMEEYINGQK